MELNIGVGCYIRGYEKMWNGKKVRFLWKITRESNEGITVDSFVLAESANVRKNQIPIGRSFSKGVDKKYLKKLINSGDAEIIPMNQIICSKCNPLYEYGCKAGECMLDK